MIASWFVEDIMIPRPNALARHQVTGIGSSSLSKSKAFVNKHIPSSETTVRPVCYDTYNAVYTNSNVDIVYIATAHAFHRQNCLDVIEAGKHVLCEKPFTLNAREAKEVIDAANRKGVFVMEGMWTRFLPLVQKLQKLLNEGQGHWGHAPEVL
jgi:predicted dehydrogenase